MVTNNFLLYGTKMVVETLLDFLYFPLWWYTGGLFLILRKVWGFLRDREKSLGLFVWIKNIHRPMYGQSDWQGILISIVMRIVQIIFRSVVLFFWVIVSLLLILSWLAFPLFVLYQIFFQIVK